MQLSTLQRQVTVRTCMDKRPLTGIQKCLLYLNHKQYTHILSTYIIPGGGARAVTGPPEHSFSCSASGLCPLATCAFKREHLVFFATSLVSHSPFLLRALWLASSGWPDQNLHTTQDSTMKWEATSSHWLATRPTVSMPSWWSVGAELMLRRVWAPGEDKGQ